MLTLRDEVMQLDSQLMFAVAYNEKLERESAERARRVDGYYRDY